MIRIAALAAVASVLLAAEPVVTGVDYADGGVALHGVLAMPAGAAHVPGILVVPEWWGRNDYSDRRARELAALGYAAFSCDMYGVGKATLDPKQAGEWAGPFYQDRGLMVSRARAGLAQLKAAQGVDPGRLAAIGFCFGGSVVLELARAGEPLKAVVSFHGGLKTTTKVAPGAIKARILVLHGGSDSFVPPEEVAGFITEMVAAQADWRMEVYGGATHAFTNPAADLFKGKLPIAYDPDAEKRAFAAFHQLLGEVLAP